MLKPAERAYYNCLALFSCISVHVICGFGGLSAAFLFSHRIFFPAFLFVPQARHSHTLPPPPVCGQCRRSHQKNLSSVTPALFRGLCCLSKNRLISASSHSVYFIFSATALFKMSYIVTTTFTSAIVFTPSL